MYHTDAELVRARKEHQCTYCAEDILAGEKYWRWLSVDTEAFSNKMHPECWEDALAGAVGGEFEYNPFSNDRPSVSTVKSDSHELEN